MSCSSSTFIEKEKEQQEFLKNVTVLLIKFTEKSMELACVYCKHANRNIVTLKDIVLCMKNECFEFSKRKNMLEDLKQIKKDIFENIDDEDKDEDKDEDEDKAYDDTEEKFAYSTCACNFCVMIHENAKKFENWFPDHVIYCTLKKHIQNMEKFDNS